MRQVTIIIRGKVEPKGRGRIGQVTKKSGQKYSTVFTPAHTRKYETRIRDKASEMMGDIPPLKGPVRVVVLVYLPYPKSMSRKKLQDAKNGLIQPVTRPDIDNYVKSALDGINNIVIEDDNQVVQLLAYKYYHDTPSLSIEVTELYQPTTMEEML